MTNTKIVSIWLVSKPEEFIEGLSDLLTLGFDLDRNSARDLITAVAIYKGIIKE